MTDKFMQKLTPLQTKFCEEYLVDFSPTRAAKRAGFTNPVYGRELITQPHIKAAINRIQNQVGNQTGVTIAYVVERLTETYLEAKEKGDLQAQIRALDLLGRHVGAFERDNASKGTKVNVQMNFISGKKDDNSGV